MIKHWAKLSCLVLCGQLVATACTTENDDDDGNTTTTSASGGTGGSGGSLATGGSAGEATTTASGGSSTTASGGTASGGTAGGAGDGNEAGSAGAAGASTEGYDGGQITEITGPEAVTNGGTFTIQVTIPGADDDQTFQVAVNGVAGDDVTAAPNDDGVFDLGISLADDIEGETVTVTVTPLDADGDAGESKDIDLELIETGTGDVKVTLAFDQNVDLDLLVMEPDGTEIYFDEPLSPSGGELDHDSNALCNIDGDNLENIFWPTDAAPEGEYVVGVLYYGACDVEETVNYTVTITIGDDVETFTGSFEPEEAGEAAEVRTVTTFTVD
ncbi:MAG TPA: hypothetical protein VFU02_09655 [Polyangiaceae bacterium]|nr:hypothetical protein [Polyangiaceae bacterium]